MDSVGKAQNNILCIQDFVPISVIVTVLGIKGT